MGAKVNVIGGVHKGQQATILGHTPKMYNVKLFGGKVTVVKHGSVKESLPPPEPNQSSDESAACRRLIELEMERIRGSLEAITVLLNQMNLEQPAPSQQNDK